MEKFLGESEVSVDIRGRFLMPANIRKQIPEGLGEKFVINRGFEKCISIYTLDIWNVIHDRVSKLNDFKASVRKFQRLFLNGASYVSPDSADRLLITKSLLEYAGIVKDAVLVVRINKMELWDKDTYYNYIDDNSDDFAALGESMAIDMDNIPMGVETNKTRLIETSKPEDDE